MTEKPEAQTPETTGKSRAHRAARIVVLCFVVLAGTWVLCRHTPSVYLNVLWITGSSQVATSDGIVLHARDRVGLQSVLEYRFPERGEEHLGTCVVPFWTRFCISEGDKVTVIVAKRNQALSCIRHTDAGLLFVLLCLGAMGYASWVACGTSRRLRQAS